jgi:ribose 1,5-bisphosphokinase
MKMKRKKNQDDELSLVNPGKLFYLMGASGAGKDSLINYARHHLSDPTRFKFVRRQITRPTHSNDNNNDDYLSPAEFERQQVAGNFAMSWERNGINYGITSGINSWLKTGAHVIINGSRHHYPTARKTYPDLYAIWITANSTILRQRLQKRGRETPEKINERMQSADRFRPPELNSDDKFSIIENNGPLVEAGEQFLQILLQGNR